MSQPLPYFEPRTLSKLEGVTLRARRTVEGTVTGAHRSPFHGFAAEFAEHREYTPGDDLRYVDWKVYGRSDRVFVKEFLEETNFACHLLLDASESMSYRSDNAPQSKLEFAKHLAAAVSYIVVKQQDAIGLLTFDESVIESVRPGSQPAHWKHLAHVLQRTAAGDDSLSLPADAQSSRTLPSRTAAGRTAPPRRHALESVLNSVSEQLARRGVVILLSDLFDDAEALMQGLKRLRFRKHDVRVWQIVDPAEEEFPFDDPTLFHGLEGWADLPIEPRLLRTAYLREFRTHREFVRRHCRDLSIDFVVLRTDMPIDLAVKRGVK